MVSASVHAQTKHTRIQQHKLAYHAPTWTVSDAQQLPTNVINVSLPMQLELTSPVMAVLLAISIILKLNFVAPVIVLA